MIEEMDVIKDISDIVRKHLKSVCKELTKENVFKYTLKECRLKNGMVYFAVKYQSEKQHSIGSSVLIEKEIDIKNINISDIKDRLRCKLLGKADKIHKLVKNGQ